MYTFEIVIFQNFYCSYKQNYSFFFNFIENGLPYLFLTSGQKEDINQDLENFTLDENWILVPFQP